MAKNRPWIVTPHKPLRKLEDNLWVVEGDVPGVPFDRRMTIVKRSDGSLLFFHAIPTDDATLEQIRALGSPQVLVIPHEQHGMDAAAFAEKLGLKIYGPKKQEAKLRKRWNLAGTVDQLPADPMIRFEEVEGSASGEPVGIVTSGTRVSLLFGDVFQHNDNPSFLFKLLGFGGGPKVTPAFKYLFTKDRPALKAHLLRLSKLPGLTRLVPCHGLISGTAGSPAILQGVAAAL